RLRDELRVEANGVEDLVIGPEEDGRAAATGGTDLLEGGRGPAAREALLPLGAVATHAGDQLFGERGHHRRADAVQPTRMIVALGLELPAGVQGRGDQLERRLLVL